MTLEQLKRRIKLYYIFFYINCAIVLMDVLLSQFDAAAIQLVVTVLMIVSIYCTEIVKKDLEQKIKDLDTQEE